MTLLVRMTIMTYGSMMNFISLTLLIFPTVNLLLLLLLIAFEGLSRTNKVIVNSDSVYWFIYDIHHVFYFYDLY